MQAAAEMVEAQGPQGLSLREAARRCGVSQAAPYRHFASREALRGAVAAAGFRRFTDTLSEHAQGATDPERRLKRMGRGYVAFARAHPETLRLMFGPECADTEDPDLEQAANAAYALLEDSVAALFRERDLAPSDQPVVTIGVWALVHGLARLLIDLPGEPPGLAALGAGGGVEQVIDRGVDGLLHSRESRR
ncbi:Transcriptional regulator, TetR family [Thioalkalivibrio nitratireducens DSM 14787]|uniref:Transcriptional regulator, TetR family n=1 Tax=Thioalkalivibrio nitratireducens (strain DSM 14787 / UNIQEM 213 / ALEN2) TaxID=1255043 RepID=L0E3Q0_THIND|nr:TetR/AcrR family transcriptional regulator [Thioalkalivibrio nitratireducens]AGA35301.1 Transcriptional regulator, TetR family [Thioalkalivibrio nitratireducens DSM 14787]